MSQPVSTANVGMLIRRPIQEVFNAFITPEITTKFWFTHSSAKLEEGKELIWIWEMYDLNVPVLVKTMRENELIIIEWGEGTDRSKAKWEFKTIDQDKTYVTIISYGFQGEGEKLTNQVVDSTGGFTMVLAGLKAWLEHGVELNLIGDKFPKEMMK